MFYSGIADEAGQPLDAQIRAHAELGWKHIEMRNVDGTTLACAPADQFGRIRERLEEAGLQVSCFASQIANWSRDIFGPFEQDTAELRSAMPRMRAMNTPYIRIMSWTNTNSVEEGAWRREAVRRIRELARMAEDGGATLLHENCDGWGGLGPDQTLSLIADVNSPALKLVFDTGNPVGHGQNAWEYYSRVRQHIVYVHIKDGRRVGGKPQWTFPGEGECQVGKIVADLLHGGYTGGFSIEPHIASIVHEGASASPEKLYSTYVEYGHRMMRLVREAQRGSRAS